MSIESFIPPIHNYPLMWFMDNALKVLMKGVNNVDEIVISDLDKEKLKKYKDERLIYISNHPTTKEPPISYMVGNLMYSRFHYMASREVFDWGNGVVGNLIAQF